VKEPFASPNNLRLLDDESKAAMLALARELRQDVRRMGEVIAEEVLFKERLLAATVTKLLEAASDKTLTVDEAVKLVKVAGQLHDSWQNSVAPIARRLGEDIRRMRKELEAKGGDRVGKTLQPGSARRLSDGSGSRGRRDPAGEARPPTDGPSPGGDGAVVEGCVVVPHGDGPGHE
jgi:hypothetical protein